VASDPAALKRAAALAALKEVSEGMVVGLGTGSTAAIFVSILGDELRAGRLRSLRAVCTSVETERLAAAAGIPVLTLDEAMVIDVAIDGADEIDRSLRLIKGHGGALLREKIVEQSAERFVVIADASKQVDRLGRGRLPVEVVRFAAATLSHRFDRLELDPRLRLSGHSPFVTDEGHHILDVIIPQTQDIADVVEEIRRFAGVVETGFFPDEADLAIIAGEQGVRIRNRR
jgi:ribose 5-phosphate isomerase A